MEMLTGNLIQVIELNLKERFEMNCAFVSRARMELDIESKTQCKHNNKYILATFKHFGYIHRPGKRDWIDF